MLPPLRPQLLDFISQSLHVVFADSPPGSEALTLHEHLDVVLALSEMTGLAHHVLCDLPSPGPLPVFLADVVHREPRLPQSPHDLLRQFVPLRLVFAQIIKLSEQLVSQGPRCFDQQLRQKLFLLLFVILVE